MNTSTLSAFPGVAVSIKLRINVKFVFTRIGLFKSNVTIYLPILRKKFMAGGNLKSHLISMNFGKYVTLRLTRRQHAYSGETGRAYRGKLVTRSGANWTTIGAKRRKGSSMSPSDQFRSMARCFFRMESPSKLSL